MASTAAVLWGQADRTFTLTSMGAQDRQEIATTLRIVGGLNPIVDGAVLSVSGTPDQLALADLLVSALEQAPPPGTIARARSGANEVRVFSPSHKASPQTMQEFMNALRSLAEVQRVTANFSRGAIVLLGTPDQTAFAEWLMNALDRPAGGPSTAPYTNAGRGEIAKVFYLTHVTSPYEMMKLLAGVRSTTNVQRFVAFNATHALALRGPQEQVDAAGRMIAELDKPAH